MIPTLLHATFSGTYAAGISQFLSATALDQKVFDFATPQFKQAFAFGAICSLTNLILESIIRDFTYTSFEIILMPYMGIGTRTKMYSANATAYKIGCVLAKIISAFGAVYLLKQMNYSISYRFAAVCMIPSLITTAANKVSRSRIEDPLSMGHYPIFTDD